MESNLEIQKIDVLKQVAAQLMGCEVEDVSEDNYDFCGLKVFSCGHEEWAIGLDSDADDAVKHYILDSIWAFRAGFIASHTKVGATTGMIKAIEAMQQNCESSNEDIKSLIEDIDEFIDDAISADGRGQFLNSYDGNESEIRIDGVFYYAYRLN